MHNTQIDSANETHIILRVTWTGMFLNILLCVLKFTAGILGKSQAVTADAVHSLSDTTTDLAIILGAKFWSQPPDAKHPYGHRRIETLVAIFIGFLLTCAGISIGWNAIATMQEEHNSTPGWIAFWAAIISMITKELLYHWTSQKGKEIGSLSLGANAWHHRSDALSSIPAALAVIGAIMLPSWTLLDHVGAIVVCSMILYAAFKIAWPGISELLEAGASEKVRQNIDRIARSVGGVDDVHKVRSRYVGGRLYIDLHVLVDSSISIKKAHDISTVVTNKILSNCTNVFDVIVHTEPKDY